MKKVIIILIVFSIFNINAQTVIDLTGFDWNEWPEIQKVGFVMGFMAGSYTMVEGYKSVLENSDAELNDNDVIVLLDRAALPAAYLGGSYLFTALANLAISVTLSYVANKLFAPDDPGEQAQTSSIYNLNSSQNIPRYRNPIPIIHGKVRIYPTMILQLY